MLNAVLHPIYFPPKSQQSSFDLAAVDNLVTPLRTGSHSSQKDIWDHLLYSYERQPAICFETCSEKYGREHTTFIPSTATVPRLCCNLIFNGLLWVLQHCNLKSRTTPKSCLCHVHECTHPTSFSASHHTYQTVCWNMPNLGSALRHMLWEPWHDAENDTGCTCTAQTWLGFILNFRCLGLTGLGSIIDEPVGCKGREFGNLFSYVSRFCNPIHIYSE